MIKQPHIVLLGLLSFGMVVFAPSCSTTSTAPLDDAYYWPDKKAQTTVAPSAPEVNTPQPAPTSAPAMEVISQKDTTITVRIKK